MTSALELLDRPISSTAQATRKPEELELMSTDIDYNKIVLDLVKFGDKKDVNIRASVTDANIELNIESAHQLTITVHDGDLKLYRSGALNQGIDLNLHGWYWRLVAHEKTGRDIELTFEPRPIAWMRSHRQKIKAKRGKTTRAEFILRLVRFIKKKKLKFVSPELHKIQPIGKPEQRDVQGQEDKRGAGLDSGFTLEGFNKHEIRNLERVLAVGDSMNARDKVQVATMMCVMQESHGDTSATNGVHVGLFQQDPAYWPATRKPEPDAKAWYDRVIPIDKANRKMALTTLIESVQRSGQPQNYAKWETQAKLIVSAFQGGGTGSITKVRAYQFRVLKRENHYATAMRLAEEVNWRFFTIKEAFYFMSEDDMFKAKAKLRVTEGKDGVHEINHRRDGRRKVQEVTIECDMKMWPVPLGVPIIVDNDAPGVDGKYLVVSMSRGLLSTSGTITVRKPAEPLPEPAARRVTVSGDEALSTKLDTRGGAKGIVEACVAIAEKGHKKVYVVSDYRPGSTTTSGNVSDHSSNDASRAARDIGHKGTDALTGPPTNDLDEAVVAIGEAFGRDYGDGKRLIVDTFNWKGYRIQIIWRTTQYGGHMGHIHVGARKV